MNDTKSAQFMRGLVKTVFIGCYAAFLWASIHHVAAFFDNYEQNGASDAFGSYLLAGAIDITALVTTMGVMFFRKSMPRFALIILWVFIGALALYSWLINWEYAAHFQSSALLLQPTGATTPVYDANGVLHYVPVMQLNMWLLYVNPALASCFTIFALVYSVVGEFFGAKQQTAEELRAHLTHLQETAPVQEQIRKLEEKAKKPSLIQRGKQKALELKDAVKEVTKKEEIAEESTPETNTKRERTTDELNAIQIRKAGGNAPGKSEESQENPERHLELSPEECLVASTYEKAISWLSDGSSTVSLDAVVETTNLSRKTLNSKVANHQIRATKGKRNVYKNSLVSWLISDVIAREIPKKASLKPARNEPESLPEITEPLGMIERAMLDAIQNATDKERAELRSLAEAKPLEEFTGILRERYPQYANYITEKRVARVMTFERKTVEAQSV